MSCKLPESDTGIINPLKKHLDKINRDQTIRGVMGCCPLVNAVKCWRELSLKGKLQVSHIISGRLVKRELFGKQVFSKRTLCLKHGMGKYFKGVNLSQNKCLNLLLSALQLLYC